MAFKRAISEWKQVEVKAAARIIEAPEVVESGLICVGSPRVRREYKEVDGMAFQGPLNNF